MSLRARFVLFGAAAACFGALLVWGTSGIPDFGHYRGRYGQILNHAAVKERQTTNTVTAMPSGSRVNPRMTPRPLSSER